jgi:trigger factor
MIQVEVEDTGTLQKTLRVTVPAQQVGEEYDRLVDEFRRKVNIPGFRPGKVPRSVVRSRFRQNLESELVQKLLPQALQDAVREAGISPVGDPSIHDLEVGPGKPMSFRVVTEIWPDVEVKGYDDLEIEQEVDPVTAENVDEALQGIRRSRAEEMPVDRASVAGDILEGELIPVDVNGNRLPNMESQKISLEAGSERLLPEFREASVGIAAGGERLMEVQYPEDYGQEGLRGQKRRYRLQVREIREKKLPPLDDEFARGMDPELDLEGLRSRIRERLAAEADGRALREAAEKIVDRLIQANPFPLPQGMVQRGLESIARRLEDEERPEEPAEVERRFRPLVERVQKRQIILGAVAEKEGLTVTDEDLKERIEAMAKDGDIHPARLRAAMEKRGDVERLREDMQEQKTLDFLLQKAKVHQFTRSGPEGDRVSKGGIILPGRE